MGAASAQTPAPASQGAQRRRPRRRKQNKAEKCRATAGSLECSKQADEKGLKGKERKKFRSACKKEAAEKAN